MSLFEILVFGAGILIGYFLQLLFKPKIILPKFTEEQKKNLIKNEVEDAEWEDEEDGSSDEDKIDKHLQKHIKKITKPDYNEVMKS